MKVAIVESEDFRNKKALLTVIESVLKGTCAELLIPCGSGDFETDLRTIAGKLGIASYEHRGKKNLRKIAEIADLCLAFTSEGFVPDGEGFCVVQEFSDHCKPVNVIQIGSNGNARKIMKLRHYRAASSVKPVSVMIVSSIEREQQQDVANLR